MRFLKKLPNFLKILFSIAISLLAALLLMASTIIIFLAQGVPSKLAAIIPFAITFILGFIAYKCISSISNNSNNTKIDNAPSVVNLIHDYQTKSAKQLPTSMIKPPSTPERTLESMRTSYNVNQIHGLLEIINDCIHIVSTSKNIETVIGRLELGARKTYVLEQLEQIGLYKGTPTSKELIGVFLGEKTVLINNCLQKAYKDLHVKANVLKTDKGKINRYTKFIEEIHRFDDDYAYENEERVMKFERELSLLIARMTHGR